MWRAVVTKEIDHNQLKAEKKAFSHHRSKRRIVTARVEKRAVAADEIDHNQLKAGKKVFSHLRSKRRFVTARVEKRAVAADETTIYLLLIKISFKSALPSPIIEISICDCLKAGKFIELAVDLVKSEL